MTSTPRFCDLPGYHCRRCVVLEAEGAHASNAELFLQAATEEAWVGLERQIPRRGHRRSEDQESPKALGGTAYPAVGRADDIFRLPVVVEVEHTPDGVH